VLPIEPFQLFVTTSENSNIRHGQAYLADTRVGWRALQLMELKSADGQAQFEERQVSGGERPLIESRQ
jgi:hypothetical protein